MRLALAMLMLIPAPAFARPCRVVVQKQVVVANHVAVPFAVPVGVPVATVAAGGALYSAGSHAQQYTHPVPAPSAGHISSTGAAPPAGDAALFEEFRAFLEWRAQRMQTQAKPTAIGMACAACHAEGATNPKARMAREHFQLESLSTWQGRERAQDAILNDRMPPGKPLDGDMAGNVLREIVAIGRQAANGNGGVRTQEDAPQPPRAELAPPPTVKTQDVPPDEPVPPRPEKEKE